MGKSLTRDGRPAEVLLIDDSRGDALLAERAVRDAAFEANLTVARTGEDALARLKDIAHRLPDLILLDMGLPRMSGADVLTAIKSDPELKAIPVIVMSNSGAPDNVARAYNLYAAAYIVKPVSLDAYREAIALIGQFFFTLALLTDKVRTGGS